MKTMQTNVRIMGILNVTPDSFSDGGAYLETATIQSQVKKLIDEGADILDVGGESTRPFAQAVDTEEELARVIPAIEYIRSVSEIPISIDTTKSIVAREAIAAGATIVNDISALRKDPAMVQVAACFKGPLIIMHMQGEPGNMQVNPHYDNVVFEINEFFADRLRWLEQHGVHRERVILDPGIGFGKSLEHNLDILRNLSSFKRHGCELLVGHSRKSFLHHLLQVPINERDLLTAVVSALCVGRGVDIFRVHAVKETVQAVTLASALA